MIDNNILFYENKKNISILGLRACIISFTVGCIFLLFHFIDEKSTKIYEAFPFFGVALITFLLYLYINVNYVKMTNKELETVILFKKRVYKLDTLERYECKKSHAKGYYYFTMHFAEKICVVSVLDREKFADLLNAVIEKNNTNANTNEDDLLFSP